MIEFLCPNGHKIQCPADQAGRSAKCPRCGVPFIIPDAGESESAAAAPKPAARTGPVREPQIEFLCPNGHRLHGPASLQGRPGECPECGVRFRIPTYDEVSDEEEAEQDIGVGRADARAQGTRDLDSKIGQAAKAPARDAGSSLSAVTATAASDSSLALTHPLARIFARLWVEKARGAIVELHVDDGEKLVPDHFAKNLSQPSHGVFAVKDESGSFTLSAIPWDSVRRLVVRGVKKLPEGTGG